MTQIRKISTDKNYRCFPLEDTIVKYMAFAKNEEIKQECLVVLEHDFNCEDAACSYTINM